MGMIKNINHWVLCCIFIHFWQRQVISCIFRQYCVLVIWAVFCEFRSIEGCTSLVGVLLAGNQEIVVRFYLCPFFCFKFIVLKDFLFLPPQYICHSFCFESLCFLCAIPSPYWQMNLCSPRCAFLSCAWNLILLESCVLFLSFSWRISSFLFAPFCQTCQYFQTAILKWQI